MAYRLHFKMSDREEDICRELATRHLGELGADRAHAAVHQVVEMIYESARFRKDMKRISGTPIDRICGSLPEGNAGTRAKSFLESDGIRNVESLVRLTKEDVERKFGFGPETANVVEGALEKNKLSFAMLFPTPLNRQPTG